MTDLTGQLALVTGASRGIGAATAKALAAAGAHVILTARDAKALEAVEEAIHQAGGNATIACSLAVLHAAAAAAGEPLLRYLSAGALHRTHDAMMAPLRALIDRGCRKLAHITGPQGLQLQANRRDEAFIDTCKRNGIEPIVVSTLESNFSNLDYYRDIENLLTGHAVDGLFLGNDIMAAQTMQIAARLGVSIPDQLKIVGFDDISLASLTTPALTTIRQPVDEIGKYAVDVIQNQLNGTVVPTQIVLPVTLVKRGTT